jgi:hypothetical protein
VSRHARRQDGNQEQPAPRSPYPDQRAADEFAAAAPESGYPDAYAAGPFPDQDDWAGPAHVGQPYPPDPTQIFPPPAGLPPEQVGGPWAMDAGDPVYGFQPEARPDPGGVFGDQPAAAGQPSARENYLTGDYTVLAQHDADGSGADWDPHALSPSDHEAEHAAPPESASAGAWDESEPPRRTGSRRSGSRRPRPEPVEVNDVRVVLIGTAAWLAAFLVLLPFRDTLRAHGHGLWMWICLTGAGLGLIGLYYVHRRREALAAADRADSPRQRHEDEPRHDPARHDGSPDGWDGPADGGHQDDGAGGVEFAGEPRPFYPGQHPESADWPDHGLT